MRWNPIPRFCVRRGKNQETRVPWEEEKTQEGVGNKTVINIYIYKKVGNETRARTLFGRLKREEMEFGI